MSDAPLAGQTLDSAGLTLRAELGRDRMRLMRVRSALAHLVQVDGQELFNDEVVARIRGMSLDLAYRLLIAQSQAEGSDEGGQIDPLRQEAVGQALVADPSFLAHAHMLVLEGQLAERLHFRSDVDAVSPLLVKELVTSKEPFVASVTMSILAAQARFMQHYRRMELPLEELPADVFHAAVMALRDGAEGPLRGEPRLRVAYDEGASRLGLLERLIFELGEDTDRILHLDKAGVALFASALAQLSGESRELTVIGMADSRSSRLCLSLLAAGARPDGFREQMDILQHDSDLPFGFEAVQPHEATQWLATTR